MNVPDQFKQVFIFVADNSVVSALKEVADFAMPAIEILRIALLEPLHEFGQRRL
jgi:hypothetical protein